MVKLQLNFHGLENRFSREGYELIKSEPFQEALNKVAGKHGINPQDIFDSYLMAVSGEPVGKHKEEDVKGLQQEAVKTGLMQNLDVALMEKHKDYFRNESKE